MDSLDNFRERFEALEQRTEQLMHHTRTIERRLRWWRGMAGGLLILGLLSWALPSGKAQDASSAKETGRLAQRVAALEDKLVHVTRVDTDLFITGANLHIVNGWDATNTVNGLGNLIVGYNEPRSSGTNTRVGSHNVVVGMRHNFSQYGGLVVGLFNEINGPWASVSGGTANTAYGASASVSGGTGNIASVGASVSGGLSNTANGANASVSGGIDNAAIGDFASVCGGRANLAVGDESSVSGGTANTANGRSASVSGGVYNSAPGLSASVSGGARNRAKGVNASVSGGTENSAEGSSSSVSGGINNAASSQNSSVGEGRQRNLTQGLHVEQLPVQPLDEGIQRGRGLEQGVPRPGSEPVLLALQRGIALLGHGIRAEHIGQSPQSLGEGE
jgi:hypothetical protein